MACYNFLKRNKYFILFGGLVTYLSLYVILKSTTSVIPSADELFWNLNTIEKVSSDVEKSTKNVNNFDVASYLHAKEYFNLSGLGRYLYLTGEQPPARNHNFKILIWKDGKEMEHRHLYYFHGTRHDPFANCSVNNCYLDYNDSSAADADAILVLLHRLQGAESLPKIPRPEGQRWVFLTDESPFNTFTLGHAELTDLAGLFNWSMSYKAESDVPVPYGRTVLLEKPIVLEDSLNFQSRFEILVPNAKKKRRDVLVAVMMSNCYTNNGRLEYVRELQKHMDVDFYGSCSSSELKHACPGSYGEDCELLEDYLFYLAFENSDCDQYMTEKAFSHGYRKGAVPIIMGSRNEINFRLLPPYSYLNVADFKSPKELSDRLWFINATLEESYWQLHQWRQNLAVLNEHGYMNTPSVHFCRLCEALNYNDKQPKVYGIEELKHFLGSKLNCYNEVTKNLSAIAE